METKIINPKNYQVALYIRLSKEDDREGESQSVTNQRSMLMTYADNQGLTIFDEYIDDGVSGTTFDRPEFKRLLVDIEAKKVNMVITKDMSRLGRDYILTGHYMEKYFPEHKVRYLSLLDGIDTGVENYANEITPFKAIMNDLYAKDISKKIKSVKHDKQQKGLFIGGKAPFGYVISKTEKNRLSIDEEAAKTVKLIYHQALSGMTCRQIAMYLNERNIKSPAEYARLKQSVKGPYTGMWSSEAVTALLKNEVYIGNMVQGRIKKISYKSKKVLKLPPEEWIIVENTHPPIIEKESFEIVQKLINSRRHIRCHTYEYLLKGLIYCHECGYPLAVIKRTLANGTDTLYFVCRTYQRFTKLKRCTCHNIRVDAVTEEIINIIYNLCKSTIESDEFHTFIEQAYEEVEKSYTKIDDLQQLTHEEKVITKKMDIIYLDKISNVLEPLDFQRIYNQLKEDRKIIKDKISFIETKLNSTQDEKLGRIEDLIRKFLENIDKNKELLINLIERIELSEQKEIFIQFQFDSLPFGDT